MKPGKGKQATQRVDRGTDTANKNKRKQAKLNHGHHKTVN